MLSSIVSTILNIPLVTHVHHFTYLNYPMICNFIFSRSEYILHVSQHSKSQYQSNIGINDNSKHKLIRSPIDVDRLRDQSRQSTKLKNEFNVTEEHVVSLIGRLAENKGHYDFVRAAEYALTELNDVAFVIVGDGDQAYREALEGFAEECGVRDNTIFTGYWENIADVYSLSDIIIVPSTNENLPKVIQESFVYKTPVIAKDSGGIGELVINGDTGILVDDDDEGDQLSEQIINLLSSPKYKEKIIENAADKVENEYSKNVVQSEIENVYSSVVE